MERLGNEPLVSIIIVSYNTRELLRACLNSIYEHVRGVTFEIVVVDNASSDGTVEMVHNEYPAVKLISSKKNLGFGVANNVGAQKSHGSFLVFLNSDTVLHEDTISVLLGYLQKTQRAGIVGPAVYLPDGTLQPRTCGNYPKIRVIINDALLLSKLFPGNRYFQGMHLEENALDSRKEIVEVEWISGVCMLTTKRLFHQVGGFDPDYFMYTEDVDLCRRIRKNGWSVFRINSTSIVHYCGASSKTEADKIRNSVLQQENLMKMLEKTVPPAEVLLARLFLTAGLVLRLIGAAVGCVTGNKSHKFLWKSSVARLRALLGIQRCHQGW